MWLQTGGIRLSHFDSELFKHKINSQQNDTLHLRTHYHINNILYAIYFYEYFCDWIYRTHIKKHVHVLCDECIDISIAINVFRFYIILSNFCFLYIYLHMRWWCFCYSPTSIHRSNFGTIWWNFHVLFFFYFFCLFKQNVMILLYWSWKLFIANRKKRHRE